MTKLENIAQSIAEKHTEQGAILAILHHGDFSSPQEGTFFSHIIADLLILKGSLQITIDDTVIECTPHFNNTLCIKPMHKVTNIKLSKGFQGLMLILSKLFMDVAEKGVRSIPFQDMLSIRSQHAVTLPKKEINTLQKYFQLLEKNVSTTDYPLDKEIFQHSALLYHLKIFQAVLKQTQKQQSKGHISQTAFLCDQFLKLLVQHVEKQHSVSFYAEQLHISSHYLTKISKQYLKATSNEIISRELVSQISNLLRNPSYSLQQIADRLNFYDQSSFNKFFKRHTGKTPGAYRSEINLPITISTQASKSK